MKNIASNFIMIFSGGLAFIAGLLFITDTHTANQGFQATMNTLFVPSLIVFTVLVAFVKVKQHKEGLSL